jgi:GDP/UDP-N,N'-diacetylbacillosamine 2-epimerase (hydrolysing)
MKVCVLTSSRADYGIYRPLLQKFKEDKFFQLSIIAFGTHLSPIHGYTLTEIEKDGFIVDECIESLILGDSAEAISTALGLTVTKFSSIWAKKQKSTDLIFCLGDRYEMLAAVLAAIPFNIPIAHIHGGETTLGAIDNKFRHSLTQLAQYHFVSTQDHADRVAEMLGTNEKVYNVGALSLDNLLNFQLLSKQEFFEKYQINIEKPTILFTFHPETVSFERNEAYIKEIIEVLNILQEKYQIIITMPNADTMGYMIRENLKKFANDNQNAIFVVESFGTLGYFSALQYCSFLLGNTSSGIIEAASFGKYVINIGDRQKGRNAGKNVLHTAIQKEDILKKVDEIQKAEPLNRQNIYGDGTASEKIIKILKNE